MTSNPILEGFLEAFALLNNGDNHGASYTIEVLPRAISLHASLATYFSAMSTSRVPPQPADAWDIRIEEIEGNSALVVEHAVRCWFFEQEFSPKLAPECADYFVKQFLTQLDEVACQAPVFRVNVSPPMWYECEWEDYAFDSPNGRLFLHFGHSD